MSRYFLASLLGIAFVARVTLALHGGQYFFPDESRFLHGISLYRGLLHGQWESIGPAFATSQHAAFPLVGVLVAPPAHLLALLTGTGDWSQIAEVRASAPLLAAVLSLFSVANIWLVHRVARAYGAARTEADLAALFATASGCLFYFSRHLLPYDCALTALLAGLWIAAAARTPLGWMGAGLGAGGCVALYLGYWFLAPIVVLALWAYQGTWRGRLRTAIFATFGGLLGAGALLLPAMIVGGRAFWRDLAHFSSSVTQGLFAEGWSFPFEYLWQAEGGLGLAAGALLLAAIPALRQRDESARRARLWLAAVVAIYLTLVLCSVVLQKFVVYGRSARPSMLFVCLAAGWSLDRLLAGRPRWRWIACAAIMVLGAINLAPHFRMAFPGEIKVEVWARLGVPKFTATFTGISPDPYWPATTRPDLAFVNPLPLAPLRAYTPPPAGRVLQEWPHPYAFSVYRYESHTPRERRLLREHPPAMQVILLANPAAVPEYPPVEFFLTKADFSNGYDRPSAPPPPRTAP